MSAVSVPVDTTDPVNARILAVSEDKIQGFLTDPLVEIAGQSGVDLSVVIERIKATPMTLTLTNSGPPSRQ